MDHKEEALKAHKDWQGKIEVISRARICTMDDLAIAYTPGVAAPCMEIAADVSKSYEYTRRHNLVLVITDGTAVLGLGDIGPEAGMPVMEGKCALLKEFADVDGFPLCIRSKEVEDIVKTIQLISGSFGGVNLEDIAAPRCFEIEKQLKETIDIPVFHDDQHGTAVVTAAALLNALRLTGKSAGAVKVVINGAGASAIAVARLLLEFGISNILICDTKGIIYQGREGLNSVKEEIAAKTNLQKQCGSLADALQGVDVFIGLSVAGVLTKEMVATMAQDAIVFAMANPTPEIYPDDAKAAGARITGTGRSDFANQINNVLAFPGIFRGTLDVRASDINNAMNLAAARAIAEFIPPEQLHEDYILPDVFEPGVAEAVAEAVRTAAKESGVARL